VDLVVESGHRFPWTGDGMVRRGACGHKSEPDPAEQARWHGAETAVLECDWFSRDVAAVTSTKW